MAPWRAPPEHDSEGSSLSDSRLKFRMVSCFTQVNASPLTLQLSSLSIFHPLRWIIIMKWIGLVLAGASIQHARPIKYSFSVPGVIITILDQNHSHTFKVNISQLNCSYVLLHRWSCSQSIYMPRSPTLCQEGRLLSSEETGTRFFLIFNCKHELDTWHTLRVFKTSLCNVICHGVFITMPTGRTLLLPLLGKLKTVTEKKKKTYLFTSCFHSGREEEIVWVCYLAHCERKDIRPCYIFVCSDGGVVTHNDCPLALLSPNSEN